MKPATVTGWAMKAVWEPAIDLVVAPMRSAMNRSASGGMALSCSDTRYLIVAPDAVRRCRDSPSSMARGRLALCHPFG